MKVAIIGLDLAKHIFQVHGVDVAYEGFAGSAIVCSAGKVGPLNTAILGVLTCLPSFFFGFRFSRRLTSRLPMTFSCVHVTSVSAATASVSVNRLLPSHPLLLERQMVPTSYKLDYRHH